MQYYIIIGGSSLSRMCRSEILNPVEEHPVQNMCTVHRILYNVGGAFCEINLNLVQLCHQKFHI